MRKTTLYFAITTATMLLTVSVKAQIKNAKDTAKENTLEEVVVTATRTEKKLSNVAVPVTVVNQKTIQQSGSLRLNNILQEQSGLYITNNSFGNGVQIQGLSPDYVMILIDGEPLVGRNGGVLDLNRITVNNIKQIEIVKGPSSSLYGSEAMGGVVNIITQQSKLNTLSANFRYGSFNTTDANIAGSYHYKKFNLSAFVNRNSTDGYDFDKTDIGQTVMPYQSYTSQIKLDQQISNLIKVGASFRYYYEKQNDLYSAGTDIAKGQPTINEYNINPYIQFHFNNKIQSIFKGYFSQYQADTKDYIQRNDSLYYNDFFQQRFQRIENQTDIKLAANNDLNIGGGYTYERLNTNRYSGIRTNTISYIYLQDEHRFGNKVTAIGGLRYDNNAAYTSRVSPKLAVHIKATSKLNINASYGAGFKAPDYRQLYLNFTNNTAGGYTVYGANEISAAQLQQQLQAGILSSITPFGSQLKLLNPEYSTGLNLGASYQFNKKLSAKINVFRNDIENLIVTKIIAYKPSNAPVYSYFNINSAFTEGAETEIKYQLTKQFRIEGGYQFLITADKDVLKQIKEGQVFGKKEGSLVSYQLQRSDYGGLLDRSKHIANLKLFYENKSWFATIRGLYRSRWGVGDVDGNLILNRDDEYAKGYIQLNISGGKSLNNGLQIKAGIDNVTNYRNERYLSNLSGITYYFNIAYQFFNNKKQQ
jgi:outer membrane receptor for ferrienterochelin and colicins